MPSFFRPVFGSNPVQIPSTPKAVTPFGGLVCLLQFFNKIGLAPKLAQTMPFTLHSPNAIPPAHTLMAFVISVVAGAKRFAHTDWLRFDKALHAMLGIARFPGADTVPNLFARFNQGTIETFWRPLWRWVSFSRSSTGGIGGGGLWWCGNALARARRRLGGNFWMCPGTRSESL